MTATVSAAIAHCNPSIPCMSGIAAGWETLLDLCHGTDDTTDKMAIIYMVGGIFKPKAKEVESFLSNL